MARVQNARGHRRLIMVLILRHSGGLGELWYRVRFRIPIRRTGRECIAGKSLWAIQEVLDMRLGWDGVEWCGVLPHERRRTHVLLLLREAGEEIRTQMRPLFCRLDVGLRCIRWRHSITKRIPRGCLLTPTLQQSKEPTRLGWVNDRSPSWLGAWCINLRRCGADVQKAFEVIRSILR